MRFKRAVYELFTHRDCGAAFIRGYVSSKWTLYGTSHDGPLSEDEGYRSCSHRYWSRKHLMYIVITERMATYSNRTCYKQCQDEDSGYRKVFIPDRVKSGSITFDEYPVCMRKTRDYKNEPSKIMDHVAQKGKPFTTLVRTQISPAERSSY